MSNNRYQTESVDDDQFLRHPRAGSSGYMLSNQYNQLTSHHQPPPQPRPASQQTNNSLEQQRQVSQTLR